MRFRVLPALSSRRTLRGSRRRGERGSVAVEVALLVPVLAALVFGTIEVTFLMRSYIAVTSMSREGARVASSVPREVETATGQAAAAREGADAVSRSAATLDFSRVEVWVYLSTAADGRPPATCTTNCRRYTGWDPGAARFTSATGTWNPTNINACLLTGNTDQRSFVGVQVIARHDWVTKFFPGTGTTVRARSVLKFEPILVPPATECRQMP